MLQLMYKKIKQYMINIIMITYNFDDYHIIYKHKYSVFGKRNIERGSQSYEELN